MRPEHTSHVIAICSGKGGVGKSSIAVNLGLALSRANHRVCLFDADAGMANVNILMGLKPTYGLEHVVLSDMKVNDIMLSAPHGLKVIPGANGIEQCADLSSRAQVKLAKQLADIERQFDYLLIDTAAGMADSTLSFILSAQHTLLVITTEPTSLTDAFSLIKVLRRKGRRRNYHVIVNMCSHVKQAREVYTRFAGAVSKYIGVNVSYAGYILQDESLRAAVTMQSPVALFPETDPSCRHFLRLADSLTAKLAETPAQPALSRYWYRLSQNARSNKSTDLSFHVLQDRLLELIGQGKIPVHDLTRLRDQLNKVLAPPVEKHLPRFDSHRFGSQQQLISHLRANPDKPISELIPDTH
ncbi:MinD/ParA family protein [Pseudohongiella spirulinae]|uniref:Cobyrinic acid a,c-diamide synthase n=1 Tax=Pseudohongiella spirulinae TaxID=1249552 RepID=A0A0S2KC25_9GAMM|nr:MinD/ParA family protein [Pseudohongiella spirulinae]ALO45620.1 Cobyrinic acid a,c-diamide synthase [Pseudohongiella spirulinae]